MLTIPWQSSYTHIKIFPKTNKHLPLSFSCFLTFPVALPSFLFCYDVLHLVTDDQNSVLQQGTQLWGCPGGHCFLKCVKFKFEFLYELIVSCHWLLVAGHLFLQSCWSQWSLYGNKQDLYTMVHKALIQGLNLSQCMHTMIVILLAKGVQANMKF